MEPERPSLGENDGAGPWHSATKPDSNAVASERLVPGLAGEQGEITDAYNELQKPIISSNSTINAGKQSDSGSIHEAPTAEPQQPAAQRLDNFIASQMAGYEEISQQLQDTKIETNNPNGMPNLSGDTPLQHNHLPQTRQIYQSQGTDLDMDNLYPQEERHVDAHEVAQSAKHGFIQRNPENLDVIPDQNKDMEPKDEMDSAFESLLVQDGANNSALLDRTTSFPEVPPLHDSTVLLSHGLPKSQAEDILEVSEALEHRQVSFADDMAPVDRLTTTTNHNEDDNEFLASMGSAAGDPLSNASAEEEVRYEEGIPLVQSEDLQGADRLLTQSSDFYSKTAQADPKDEDVRFLENPTPVSEDLSSFRPQPLDRKTTEQVLEALDYKPHATARQALGDSHMEESKDTFEKTSSLADLTGGGIAVSAQTVESEVFAEERNQSVASTSNEDDLAELWKAALGDDELLDDEGTSVDPSVLFGDDEGFLDDLVSQDENRSKALLSPPLEAVHDAEGRIQGFEKADQGYTTGTSRYVPVGATQSQQGPSSNHQNNQYSSSIPMSVSSGAVAATSQQPFGALAPPRPQMPPSTQSFADKSKGGYTSPYDLPMDITRPKKRNYVQHKAFPDQVAPNPNARIPPPRSSSMFSGTLPSSQPEPALPNVSRAGSVPTATAPMPPASKANQNASGFFEDLAPKPRPSTSAGKYTISSSQHQVSQVQSMALNMGPHVPTDSQSQQVGVHNPQAYQLRQPEKMSLFGNTPPQQSPIVPVINSRYSPAPHHVSSVPPPRNRYASSPMGASQPAIQGLPFQPRTSSPLAQSSLPRQSTHTTDGPHGRPGSDGQQPAAISRPSAPQLPHPNYQEHHNTTSSGEQLRGLSPPLADSRYAPLSDSPSSGSQAINTPSTDRLSSDGPNNHQSPRDPSSAQPFGGQPRMPPQRSQTQSPGGARTGQEMPPNQAPYQRPASVSENRAHVSAYSPNVTIPEHAGRTRGYSEAVNFVRPTDGREFDPLERWKGCPIIDFGFGGNIVTSFPVQIPRYAAGQKTPMIKCSPGEVRIQGNKLLILDESITTFPGPLKAKSKKREVLDWLQNRVSDLEKNAAATAGSGISPDSSKYRDEKVLLWKTVKIFVEHDGTVDGNQAAERAVRAILSPELTSGDPATLSAADITSSSSGIVRRGGAANMAETVDPNSMEELRKILLHGDREKAVWLAVDNRMWAHAMLIATTLDPKIWKQVSSEFIKKEVKAFAENTESLSALYQVFSGNSEESIDELVPPSARAGLQMVSKAVSNGPTKNALDGLDRWRETLTLIMSNRTPEDGKVLVALGQLLAGYGRTEAAHICYIFAKSPALFGGPDDPQAGVTLLGTDHIRRPSDYARDMDSILLTEVYDYALTTLASSSAVTISPYLQSYKLYHAIVLAEYGYKMEAQQYCDNITGALRSTTRLSPYYHPLLFGALENLTERLRQAPKDGSTSWISRPSIDKVSGSIWAKFNSYVAGDESDAASTGSGMPNEAEAGPFARLAGDSPSISRTPSVSDLYGSHSSGLGLAPATMPISQPVNSRYAPAGLYHPRSSQEQPKILNQEPQRQESLRSAYNQQKYQSRPLSSNGAMQESHMPQYESKPYAQQQDNHLPNPPTQSEYVSETPPDQPFHFAESSQPLSPRTPAPYAEQHQPLIGDQPTQNHGHPSSYQGSQFSYESPPANVYNSFGYEPPSSSGYEPPANQSYEPPSYEPLSYDSNLAPAESSTEEQSRRPDIMNDGDDDFEARAAAMRKEERARKDREADETMRKAAEEDARKDANPKLNTKKSGWFGGWLGSGSKEPKELTQQQGNAPIKVKLGEESSFYFDKEKGKWVNKKAGLEEKASAPPPPPPRGAPSRAPTSTGGPPAPFTTGTPPIPPMPTGTPAPPINLTRPPMSSNPASTYTSRSGTPATGEAAEMTSAPTSSGLSPAVGSRPGSGPPSAPPSRPTTSQGGAGGLDDLIGAPQARKGGTVRAKAKRKGYVDVMAK